MRSSLRRMARASRPSDRTKSDRNTSDKYDLKVASLSDGGVIDSEAVEALLLVASRPRLPGERNPVLLDQFASEVLLCELVPSDETEARPPMLLSPTLDSLASKERVARLFLYALLCSRSRLLVAAEVCDRFVCLVARLHPILILGIYVVLLHHRKFVCYSNKYR